MSDEITHSLHLLECSDDCDTCGAQIKVQCHDMREIVRRILHQLASMQSQVDVIDEYLGMINIDEKQKPEEIYQ